MKTIGFRTWVLCLKCGQKKDGIVAGYCPTCLEIIQVAEEKKRAKREWAVDLNKKGEK